MLKLIPVVEVHWRDRLFDWAPWKLGTNWVELGPECSDDNVTLVVGVLAKFNRVDASGSLAKVTRALVEEQEMALPGGLMARSGEMEIAPSCCCGLEDWREWYDVKPGGSSPWLGHNPSPRFDCKSDAAVIWADADLGDHSPKISATYAEIENALLAASDALKGFERRLSDWLAAHGPQSQELSRRFAEEFDIA